MVAIKNKIERLTPEQEAALPALRDQWLRIGLCTEPADRPSAEAAICRLYQEIDKPAPVFLWFSSPAMVSLAITLLTQGQLRAQLNDQLLGQLRDQLRDQLNDQLRAQLRAQ